MWVGAEMKNKKLKSAIILVFVGTLFVSCAQLFLKFGADKFEASFISLINLPLVLGIIFYGIGAIIMILALKHGDLSIVYPFFGLSFVWVSLLSLIFLAEILALSQWLGILIIITGVSFVGWGANHA